MQLTGQSERMVGVNLEEPFDFSSKVAVITGGGGVLCGTLARGLAQCGARVAVLDILLAAAEEVAGEITRAGGQAIPVQADVLDKQSLQGAVQAVHKAFGRIDILVNGAGGAKREATTSDTLSFFDLPEDAVRWVFDLNMMGTFLPCQIFGRYMVDHGGGSILNISSMAAARPLTKSVAYSAAKAAVANFTQWLAVHISQEYSSCIRVNALMPGFFLTTQNRFLLIDEERGAPTERGHKIIEHTPMGRFGSPEDLLGPAMLLLSDLGGFMHGTAIAVDGGFSIYGGV
jgi:NAD(P)-dependent dehydrogenase (short-subunit alcohol dehydrogenase family)